jgi:hypothetical protein
LLARHHRPRSRGQLYYSPTTFAGPKLKSPTTFAGPTILFAGEIVYITQALQAQHHRHTHTHTHTHTHSLNHSDSLSLSPYTLAGPMAHSLSLPTQYTCEYIYICTHTLFIRGISVCQYLILGLFCLYIRSLCVWCVRYLRTHLFVRGIFICFTIHDNERWFQIYIHDNQTLAPNLYTCTHSNLYNPL